MKSDRKARIAKNKIDIKSDKTRLAISLIVALVVVGLTVFLSAYFTDSTSDWYQELQKPSQFAPDAVFPIVWSLVYAIFVFAIAYLIYTRKMTPKLAVLTGLNLVLQILWCLAYFTLFSLLGSTIIIVFLLIVSIWLLVELDKVAELLSVLMSIYPLWIIFATLLNISTWILN